MPYLIRVLSCKIKESTGNFTELPEKIWRNVQQLQIKNVTTDLLFMATHWRKGDTVLKVEISI